MKFRIGACALLVCLAGCSGKTSNSSFDEVRGIASASGHPAKAQSVQLGRKPAVSIASAPDHGELIGYSAKGREKRIDGARTWYPIVLSEEHALKAVVTGVMNVPMPDGSQVKLRYERHEEQADGNWTWIGRIVDGDQRQEALITFGEKAVYGSIPQKTGAPLSLMTRNGSLWAVQTDLSKVKSPNTAATDVMVPPSAAIRAALEPAIASAVALKSTDVVSAAAPPTSANTIDIVIGYSQGFVSAPEQGNASAAMTRLVNLVAYGNTAFINSKINGSLRLVNALQVTYADNTPNSTALAELTGNNGTSAVTIPASLQPLRAARDQYGADLVVLLRDFQRPENDGCGIAWLNGSHAEGQPERPINPATDAAYGYAVVSDGNDDGYYCANESMVHELAHLMGSAHDRENSRVNSALPAGGTNQLYGRYAYSFGMKTTPANGNFYTIMAYGEDNQTYNRIFSTPSVSSCGPGENLPCGVADTIDNARSLGLTIPVVALFRNTIVPIKNGTPRDINGDGRSDIFWRNQPAQQFSHWAMDGNTIVSSIGKVMDGTYTLSGSGDFNGDGLSDVLWINTTARYVVLWQSNGDGTYQQLETGGYAAGIKFSGIGDFNNDGRSDILWHDTAANQMFYWSMNGRIATPSAKFGMPGWYDIIAVGDFNADGYADVAYASASDVNLYMNTAGTSFAGKFLAYRPGGWTFLGAADSNGDKNSDLYWRNNSTGTLTYWVVVNGAITSTPSYNPDPVLSFAAFGDYNGDGRADILWNRSEWRQLSIWTSQTSGTFSAAVVGYFPAGWDVVR